MKLKGTPDEQNKSEDKRPEFTTYEQHAKGCKKKYACVSLML